LIYPFKLDSCTEGPLTYRGKLFDVEWYLRARADLGAFARVKSEENFTLVADSAGAEALPLSFARKDEQLKPLAFTNLPLVCLFLVFLAYAGFRHPIPWYYFILAFLLFCFYPVGLLRRLRRKLVERKVGPVAVKLGAAPAHAGEHLRWSVAFQPRRALHLTEATARLKSVERIKTGPQLEDYSEAAGYEREVSLASPQNLEAGQSVVFEGSIPLPAGAPYTFTGTRSSVRCEFDVRLKIGESLARWRARYWRGKYQINTIQKPDFVVEVEAFPTPGETSQRGDA
jgi:hypothetical protein